MLTLRLGERPPLLPFHATLPLGDLSEAIASEPESF